VFKKGDLKLTIKIESKIKKVEIVEKENKFKFKLNHKKLIKRPQELKGSTYKLKPGNIEYAIYLTINDIDINGELRPYEIFINTKNATSIQWISSLTRMVSALFRDKAGNEECDVAFIIEELLTVYDPSDMFFNGEFTKHPITMPSTVSYIGYQIRKHLIRLGLYEIEECNIISDIEVSKDDMCNANICPKCNQKTYVKQDCWICLECGYSTCG